MIFHQIISRFVLSILLVWSSSSVGATHSIRCDQRCGSGSNGPRVPYPFGFSEGCGIRLNCTETTGDIRIGEYLIQNVTSDTLMVNFPVNCSRPVEDLQQFWGANYGMTWRNELLLENCKLLRNECTAIPSELLSIRLNIQSCDSKKENVSCYSEANADYLDYRKLRNTGCGIVVSSILIGMDNDTKNSSAMFLEFQTLGLAWGLEGDCACHNDANCTNIFLPGTRNGFRCRCKDGFTGDGFRDGDGCRKERSKAKHLDSRVLLAVIVPVALSVLVLCSYGAYYKLSNSRKAHPWNDGQLAQIPRLTYREIFGATDGFSEDNMVTNLDLSSRQLAGVIPPSIGNLSFLTGINLKNNSFHGEIPQAIGLLLQLQYLNLSSNSFSGKIPTNLTYCKELRVLDLYNNHVVGKIVDQLSSLSKLYILRLKGNSLTGGIPQWVGNFSSLKFLDISDNELQGPIPHDLGRLTNLLVFFVNSNELSGTIPSSIFNISSIYYFSVSQNLLHGQIPEDVGLTLPNLEVFAGAVNSFTGPIPVSLANATKLNVIDFSQNKLIGDVPTSFGKLKTLVRLNFEANRLGGRGSYEGLKFLDFLINCTNLMVLSFATNNFRGELPYSITNLSTVLEIFSLGNNRMHGTLPAGVGNLISLTLLGMDGNYLNGSVPEAIDFRSTKGFYRLHPNRVRIRQPSVRTWRCFSFGIVLLELFIGKRPTDEIFNESLNIHKYVSTALPEHVMEIVDPLLLSAEEEQNINQDQARRVEECLLSVLEIGLTCSASLPRDRVPIDIVLSKLQAIKESFLSRR
ncbi:hypothetical protein HAX54_021663 [Datura stramonium]|uniref:EGF-like domain-containing protein n=1 Tax=Datura stramonium TaxID=4076 RepID=A0ABS8RKA8_DATST|nr:hypothetical protein [Datura stramonium]